MDVAHGDTGSTVTATASGAAGGNSPGAAGRSRPASPLRPSRRTVLRATMAAGGAAALAGILPAYSAAQTSTLLVGRGIGDITGEPLSAGMNGYATLEQMSTGLHLRQRARAFVFADPAAAGSRVALVTCELGLMFQSIQQEVLRRLAARFGDTYTEANVILSATHTHVAPGGTSGHPMVDLSMLGFRPRTFEANVAGIVDAIAMAHGDLAPTDIGLGHADLVGVGVNRSQPAFDANPEQDKAHFPHAVDTRSQTLQMYRGGQLVGVLNWFGEHATSMTDENTLVSSDNKGYAALHWEREVAGQDYLAHGVPALVTAFAQSTAGDVSPNLDLQPGKGPTDDQFENTREIGTRQFDAANGQVGGALRPLGGGIDIRHKWYDMSAIDVRPEFTGDGQTHRTAVAALGAAFAAGSQEDGGGGDGLPFNEGERGGNPVVRQIGDVVIPQWLRDAQGAKDVLLPVGLVPNAIQRVYPFHLLRLGGHYIFALPFEVTTVAGLRLRETLAAALGLPAEQADDLITIQGYSNGYGHYLTTPEEYATQNYEGGATAFGPWQLPATQQIAAELAESLRDGTPLDPGTAERDLTGLIPASPVGNPGIDVPAPGKAFGDVIDEPEAEYRTGTRVLARFAAANPNTDLRRGGTYFAVERREADGAWTRVRDDGDWSTMVTFENLVAFTNALVSWDIPPTAAPGTYRITFSATGQGMTAQFPISGTTREFAVR
ncbi:neutral/alkaline non-lysosomal ceramidase N-terminal domain-containing protein [Dietzia sp.]|uniref:neutral/alkaline non-lysosomal ceramidase N-terminal domain-containing protein n=1 Tax=Dietzia sp. TaxID=1871616 RepID=UPI002FD8D513